MKTVYIIMSKDSAVIAFDSIKYALNALECFSENAFLIAIKIDTSADVDDFNTLYQAQSMYKSNQYIAIQ